MLPAHGRWPGPGGGEVARGRCFDSRGNAISSGMILGEGLVNPHGMVFSSWGEVMGRGTEKWRIVTRHRSCSLLVVRDRR